MCIIIQQLHCTYTVSFHIDLSIWLDSARLQMHVHSNNEAARDSAVHWSTEAKWTPTNAKDWVHFQLRDCLQVKDNLIELNIIIAQWHWQVVRVCSNYCDSNLVLCVQIPKLRFSIITTNVSSSLLVSVNSTPMSLSAY